MRAAIFTIDTGIYKAKAESAAATALKRMLEQVGFQVKAAGVLPNDRAMTAEVMRQLSDASAVDLILTTGAVEYSEEDCAPEALRAYNIRYSKKVILDRSAAGIRKKTLLINLPESAKTAKEDLEYILSEVVQVVEAISL